MKQLPFLIFTLLVIGKSVLAQEDKKPVALVFNNGLGSAGISFSYAESFEEGAEVFDFNASGTSPYVANPGLRFYTKRGFNEIGFNNILIGGRGTSSFNSTMTNANFENYNLFSSSIYFNKSYRLANTKEGEFLLGIEPTFNYQTVSSSVNNLNYLYLGRNLGGDLKFVLRWENYLKENIFFSVIGGFSTIYLNYQLVEHRLTDIDTPIFINEFTFKTRISQVAQITFGIKI